MLIFRVPVRGEKELLQRDVCKSEDTCTKHKHQNAEQNEADKGRTANAEDAKHAVRPPEPGFTVKTSSLLGRFAKA
ncbi:hypothetical protein D3C74_395790 [compost metagenome]